MLFALALSIALSAPTFADWTKQMEKMSCSKDVLTKENTSEPYPQVMVLVSFSIPRATLKTLGKALKPLKGKLVFRGLYNNSFKATFEKMRELGEEAFIDPLVFRTFHVTQVPAFIVRAPTKSETLEGHVIVGNISLKGALEIMADKGISEAGALLKQLEKARS